MSNTIINTTQVTNSKLIITTTNKHQTTITTHKQHIKHHQPTPHKIPNQTITNKILPASPINKQTKQQTTSNQPHR